MNASPHRKTDDNGDFTKERALSIGPNMPLNMQAATLVTIIVVSLAAGGWCWNTTLQINTLKEQVRQMTAKTDGWTGAMMTTYAQTEKEWNPSVSVPNPADIQAGRRVTRIQLQDVVKIP